MTVTASIIYKINGAVHAHTGFTESILPVAAEDRIDPEDASISFERDGLMIKLKLIHGITDSPLGGGRQWWGFHSINLKFTAEHMVWRGKDNAEIDELRKKINNAADDINSSFIAFIKYEKGHPFMGGAWEITSWQWEDGAGTVLATENIIVVNSFPGLKGELSTEPLRKSDLEKLNTYIAEQPKISVVDELLLQAKEAIFQEKVHLAVLLLAVSVEVRVKTTFLGGSSAASDAFDYSQDKGKVVVSPIEFIDPIAKVSIGQSFRTFDNDAFIKIDYLFRCRNKVVHRGSAKFRDSAGNAITADIAMVTAWWDAVSVLLKWLSANLSKLKS